MSLEEQISTRIAMAMDKAGPISIAFVPDHSQVDAYLASLRANPAQAAVTVSPGAIAPDAPGGLGSPRAVAPNGVAAASFEQQFGTADEFIDSASNAGKPADIAFAGFVHDTSLNHDGRPEAMGGVLARENDIRRGSEQAALGIYDSPSIPEDRKPALAEQQLRGGILQEQSLSQNILRNLQPTELDSINQQATSGPGTADASEAMRKAADDIAEMRALLSNGVNTAEIIKQLLQALKAM